METIICPQCKKEFQDYPSNHTKYCSMKCYAESKRKVRPRCKVCGKPVRLMRNTYCSKSCMNKARPLPGIASWTGFYARAQKANPNKMPCIICGGEGKHRHHPDYGKIDFIIWLCPVCHRRLHQLGKSKKNGEFKSKPDENPILP